MAPRPRQRHQGGHHLGVLGEARQGQGSAGEPGGPPAPATVQEPEARDGPRGGPELDVELSRGVEDGEGRPQEPHRPRQGGAPGSPGPGPQGDGGQEGQEGEPVGPPSRQEGGGAQRRHPPGHQEGEGRVVEDTEGVALPGSRIQHPRLHPPGQVVQDLAGGVVRVHGKGEQRSRPERRQDDERVKYERQPESQEYSPRERLLRIHRFLGNRVDILETDEGEEGQEARSEYA